MRTAQRILIISASAGAGHTRAAQALEEAARLAEPEAEVRHIDILEFTGKAYKKAYAGGYLKLVDSAPALWGALYQASDRTLQRTERARFVSFFDKLEFAQFRAYVREFAPDFVFATHFLPAQVLAPYRAKGRDRFPFALVLTDFDAHAFWVQPTADRFFVAAGIVRAVLAGRGINPDSIMVTGIPIARAFSSISNRGDIRRSLELGEHVPTVLVMNGGAGVGAFEETVEAVLSCAPVQVIAVAGRNEKLRRSLAALKPPENTALRVFGFVDTIADFMAAADIAVAKSGGMTVSECLAMGLPMVIRDPIPGQEERNADFVIEAGAGVKTHGLESLRYKLGTLLADRNRLARMRTAARVAGQPSAATTIVRAMLTREEVTPVRRKPGRAMGSSRPTIVVG